MSAERRPHGVHAGLGFFTALPVRSFTVVDAVVGARAIRWFWAVGAIVGVLGATVGGLARWAGGSPLVAAALAVGTLALATGAIHLDGLADTADGLGSRRSPAEALEIMRRSDIGPMGVATLVLVLLVEVASLESLAHHLPALVLAVVAGPAVARLTMLGATTALVPMARTSGFGALFGGVTPVRLAVVGLWCAPLVVGAGGWAAGGPRGALVAAGAAAAAAAVAAGWRRHLLRRLGGMTGDTFGSIIELAQATFWLVLAIAW